MVQIVKPPSRSIYGVNLLFVRARNEIKWAQEKRQWWPYTIIVVRGPIQLFLGPSGSPKCVCPSVKKRTKAYEKELEVTICSHGGKLEWSKKQPENNKHVITQEALHSMIDSMIFTKCSMKNPMIAGIYFTNWTTQFQFLWESGRATTPFWRVISMMRLKSLR